MALHRITKGLRLPIVGEPVQQIDAGRQPRRVALVADDYVGLRPTMHVAPGDEVRRGQLVLEDKNTSGVRHTAPAAGRVVAVNRGQRRAFQSVVIELSRAEREGRDAEEASFSSFSGRHPSGLTAERVRELLVESGLWTALRTRPFSRVPPADAKPHSIFVTAIDSNPLAPSIDVVLAGQQDPFARGLAALSMLTNGPVFVCTAPGSTLQVPIGDRIYREEFAGPHPAGTVGLHIHRLDPVDRHKQVWHAGAQDVVAIGRLFETGSLAMDRVIALAGPAVARPRLLRTRVGASIDELVDGELREGENRVLSGSVLAGRKASGEVTGFLGRYHQQILALREGRDREFIAWLAPGWNKFSVTPTFVSKLVPGRRFAFTTSTNGSRRAIVPIGVYEKVMPLDILPTFMLRALLMHDVERAEELGCLELDEEDLALCSFVCPGKNDYGPHLRQVLTMLEQEG